MVNSISITSFLPLRKLQFQKKMSDLPQITSTLPPRKRAKTQEEKEQRRIERILRNRRAAHASREKKRKHVEFLESSVHKLENNLKSYKAKEAKLLQLSEKLLDKIKELGGEPAGIDTSVLDEEPIPELEFVQSMLESSKAASESRGSTPMCDSSNMNFDDTVDDFIIDGVSAEEADVTVTKKTKKSKSASISSASSSSSLADADGKATGGYTDINDTKAANTINVDGDAIFNNGASASASASNSASMDGASASAPTSVLISGSMTDTAKVSKKRTGPKSKGASSKKQKTVKSEEIEASIPSSPLSTPLIKHEYISPFKSTESNSLQQSPGYLSSTLDITSNDYMSSNSSTFSDESRGSPVSTTGSSPDVSDNMSVDEYLSNLTNPLFLPSDYDNNSTVKSEFPNYFTINNSDNDKAAAQNNNVFLSEPFSEDHSQNNSSRLHNPAEVFYNFDF